jgi:hypothetical protein
MLLVISSAWNGLSSIKKNWREKRNASKKKRCEIIWNLKSQVEWIGNTWFSCDQIYDGKEKMTALKQWWWQKKTIIHSKEKNKSNWKKKIKITDYPNLSNICSRATLMLIEDEI